MKCDIFSFAITLWEMMTRKVPTIESVSANSYAILYQMVQGKEGERERDRETERETERERESILVLLIHVFRKASSIIN